MLDALLRNEQRNASMLFYRETLLSDSEKLELEVRHVHRARSPPPVHRAAARLSCIALQPASRAESCSLSRA